MANRVCLLWLRKDVVHQVGAVAEGFFQGHLFAPFGHFGVIAADQDFGDLPAAEVGGAGVVRVVEHNLAVRQSFVQGGGWGILRALEQAERFVL